MNDTNSKLRGLLNKRSIEGNKRELTQPKQDLVDFCSNDYLGFARSIDLKARIFERYSSIPAKNGATGSRLLTGNTKLAESTERLLANFFGFDDCLIFNSGYTANLAFFSTIPKRGDTILYDELAHACIKDGSRLSLAKSMAFRHNDLIDLEKKILKSEGRVFVACESVYSMDGDFAPLVNLANLCERHDANLVVDEAHSTGIYGINGRGLVTELGLVNQVFAVIYTFGKALGIHGACVASSNEVKEYLVNFARPFIYTTAPSDFDFITIEQAITSLEKDKGISSSKLIENIQLFKNKLEITNNGKYESFSPIQVVLLPGNDRAKQIANNLLNNGFDARAILSPTVKLGEERLRVCIHSFNTTEEITRFTDCLYSLLC